MDELVTYVFRVKPLQLERTRAYFDGLVWVDNHDLVIVKSYGKWVNETGPQTASELPFTLYESYRQPVENKYWLPAFSQSDSVVKTKTDSVPVRLVIRWDNYAPVAANTTAAPRSPSAEGPEGAPTSMRHNTPEPTREATH